MFLYSIASYIITRTRYAGSKLLNLIAWLPWGVPAMVLALAMLWAYVGGLPLPFSLYQSIYLIMLAMLVKGLPLGVQVMNSTMLQLGNDLESHLEY